MRMGRMKARCMRKASWKSREGEGGAAREALLTCPDVRITWMIKQT